MTQCASSILGICFVPVSTTANIFGFKDFIAALAFLIIIYTISDIRYRFRLAVAPTPLFRVSNAFIIVIGFGVLATDIWISEKWLVPESMISAAVWQGVLAALFLGLVVTWMHYAFIKPPVFGPRNYIKYAQELYRIVLKGSDSELPVISHELASSSARLVTFAARRESKKENVKEGEACIGTYASEILSLIANRKFCRHLVASSPLTAIKFFDAVAEQKAYRLPIGLFAQNISAEAIQNKDSSLYHEDEGYRSGLLGYIKPFSHSLYGNYELVESLQNYSPLDIHYELVWAWDAHQFSTYCGVVKLTLRSYLKGKYWGRRSYTLSRAIGEIRDVTTRALFDITGSEISYFDDPWHRLRVGVEFFTDSVKEIGRLDDVPKANMLRICDRAEYRVAQEDLYDSISEAMFEIIFAAACMDGPREQIWTVQHNSVWTRFFGIGTSGIAWRIVQVKLRRLLYDEIRDLESMPNFKAARILGICLNVMGLHEDRVKGYGRSFFPLKKAVLAWTKRNYLRLREVNEDVANSCLIGSISFDPEERKLVKTFFKGLSSEAPIQTLSLQ